MKKIAADKNYRILREAMGKNNSAKYQKAFDALVSHMFKQSRTQKKDGLFSWEIYQGSKGKYFQVNMLNQDAMQIHMDSKPYYLTEIARKHLGPEIGEYQSQAGSTGWMSWMLPAQ